MADRKHKSPKNVAGKFYVDCKCLDHELCRAIAPQNFARDDHEGTFYVCKQPQTDEEMRLCRQALESCPMAAIGDDGDETI